MQLSGKPGDIGKPVEYFLDLINGKDGEDVNDILKELDEEYRGQSLDTS